MSGRLCEIREVVQSGWLYESEDILVQIMSIYSLHVLSLRAISDVIKHSNLELLNHANIKCDANVYEVITCCEQHGFNYELMRSNKHFVI